MTAQGSAGHPLKTRKSHISNLARNPLMLSAICLVNYFEGGRLPEDRSKLYQLCTEGLLHHWDQRRGIHSKFTFDEKLRLCRELALAMQAQDRAECEATRVEELFSEVLDDSEKAKELVEHIRYRTGLLVERRPGVFAFAHLTFQEYLAARAVHEGNHLGIDPERLVQGHDDSRWHEVIALYCGLAPAPAARKMIELLIERPDTRVLAEVLAEAYFSAKPDLTRYEDLRKRVIERIAVAPYTLDSQLDRFEAAEIEQTVNNSIGTIRSNLSTSQCIGFFDANGSLLNIPRLTERLKSFREMNPVQLSELVYLLHRYGPDSLLLTVAGHVELYAAPGPKFDEGGGHFGVQAEIALLGLRRRGRNEASNGVDAVALQCLSAMSDRTVLPEETTQSLVLGAVLDVGQLTSPRVSLELENLAQELSEQTKPKKRAKRKKHKATA